MSGPLVLGLLLTPSAVVFVRYYRPRWALSAQLVAGAGWGLLAGGLVGAALAVAGVPPP